ncbi:phosphatidylinositol 3 and 4-kinase-domain-containing protein [Leucosporidium creatinivorum]|uniref:Phosphatidylinositol 4-kinase n=1 Tax=Leucosporidium creatinivorum TaxID=106004 RepID=A0A1Y2D0P8_9BASI|nr:phosphatidylinositol 3 and 4-kinase-domain-containing protein [Leucosporidium creatinivorum]
MPSNPRYTPLPTTDDTSLPLPSTSPRITRTRNPPSALALEVDALFRRWTSTIAERVKLKKRRKEKRRNLVEERDRESKVEILESVCERWEGGQVAGEGKGKGKEMLKEDEQAWTLDHEPPMSEETFEGLVERVRQAIEAGVQPRLNSKGSSGSYFARDASGAVLGIFKPKDEEPYGRLNPKLTKWIHRNFFSKIIPFGRACLIPQLSYLSESAASLLSRRLSLHIVPRTQVVSLSSPAFFYDWIDIERAGRKGRLPEKDGSFQVFLKGFTDASKFLAEHPWPGRPLSEALEGEGEKEGRRRRRRRGAVSVFGPLRCLCGRAEAEDDEDDDQEEGQGEDEHHRREEGFRWTEELMLSFREQLEGLVVLDYLIRNTDRGLDNFMLKPCLCDSPPLSSSTPPLSSTYTTPPLPRPPMTELSVPSPIPPLSNPTPHAPSTPHIHVAAIDNSLAFPHAHPSGWRTFTYGWLYLPAGLIGRPFSQRTRERFLPLFTDPSWWEETTLELRNEFKKDGEFREGMFEKQVAVIKGQAYNLVQSLLDPEEGPIELCRRKKKLVWDDFIEVPDDEKTKSLLAATHSLSPRPPSSSAPITPASEPNPETLLHQPIVEDPILESSTHHDDVSPALPIRSSHTPHQRALSTSPPISRRPTQQHRRTGSATATVSSVLSSHAFPEAVTGVEVVRTLDLKEREERRRGGSVVMEVEEESEEEEDEDEEEEGEAWGVRSEGDVRALLGSSAPMPSISAFASPSPSASTSWKDRLPSRGTLSFDEPRSSTINGRRHVSDTLPATRARSDSLTSLTPLASAEPTTAETRPQLARKAFSSYSRARGRPGLHGRSASGGWGAKRREGSWLGALGGRVEEGDEEEGEEAETRRKVVVVERLEELKDEPRRWWFF